MRCTTTQSHSNHKVTSFVMDRGSTPARWAQWKAMTNKARVRKRSRADEAEAWPYSETGVGIAKVRNSPYIKDTWFSHFLTMLYCAILCCIFAILCIFYWRMHSTRCSFGVSASQPADCKHCDHCFSISGPHLSSYHINIVYVLFTWCFPTAAVLWQREVECSQKCPEPWPSLCVSFCEEPQNATVDEPPRRRFTAGLVALGVAGIAGLGGLVGSCRIMSVLVLFLVTGWASLRNVMHFSSSVSAWALLPTPWLKIAWRQHDLKIF